MRILLDCDPGIDDALALFTVLAARNVELLGLCATVGNVPVETGFRNLRNLAALAGRADVPVYRGAERPLLREYRFDPLVHGENGLGGVALPESRAPRTTEHGAVATCRLLRTAQGPVTWIATGPLTTVALALLLDPGIRDKASRLVVMGGTTGRGNVTPAAEFNVYTDAEAWNVVLRSGISVTMVGLNVTQQVPMRDEDFEACERLSSGVAQAAVGMLAYYRQVSRSEGWGGAKLHDVVAVLAALSPELLRTRPSSVEVETAGTVAYGLTAVDHISSSGTSWQVAVEVDADEVRSRMLEALATY